MSDHLYHISLFGHDFTHFHIVRSLDDAIAFARGWLVVDYEMAGLGFDSLKVVPISDTEYELFACGASHGSIERW